MTPDRAEEIAVAGLVFVAGDEKLLSRFLALTGIEAEEIRKAAEIPGFLGEVLSFILAHEPTLAAFCDGAGIDPASTEIAHRTLAGNRGREWNSA